jgi:hypothetical protein
LKSTYPDNFAVDHDAFNCSSIHQEPTETLGFVKVGQRKKHEVVCKFLNRSVSMVIPRREKMKHPQPLFIGTRSFVCDNLLLSGRSSTTSESTLITDFCDSAAELNGALH